MILGVIASPHRARRAGRTRSVRHARPGMAAAWKWTLHVRLTLWATAALIVVGAVLITWFEWTNRRPSAPPLPAIAS